MSSPAAKETGGSAPALTRRDVLLGGSLLGGMLAPLGCAPQADADLLDGIGTVGQPGAGMLAMPSMSGSMTNTINMSARRLRDIVGDRRMPLQGLDKVHARRRELQAEADAAPPTTARSGSLMEPLLARTTFGATSLDRSLYSLLGHEAYLEWQLNHEAINDSAVDTLLEPYTTLNMTAEEIYLLEDQNTPIIELLSARAIRAIYSQRQLFERMVEFWTDHFNISILDGLSYSTKPVDDRDVIRKHALGKFPELLLASARSPAMLYYLDNFSSVVGNPNENYSRELMELHTMGTDGGYTQQDVVEVARCFTGWSFEFELGQEALTYRFYPDWHDFGEKTVLGNTIPAGGRRIDGRMVIDILAAHPSTARFISTKMAKWLWGYSPPTELIDEVTQTYLDTEGDIKAMIRTILAPQWLAQATPKYKRPLHYVVSAIRTLDIQVDDIIGPLIYTDVLGHLPYIWPAPNGYPDAMGYWLGNLLPRWNMGADLSHDEAFGMLLNSGQVLGEATSAEDIVDQLNTRLHGGNMPTEERDGLVAYLSPNPPNPPIPRRITDAIGLAVTAPSFHWY